jgi:hypothetical protein
MKRPLFMSAKRPQSYSPSLTPLQKKRPTPHSPNLTLTVHRPFYYPFFPPCYALKTQPKGMRSPERG